LATDWTSVFFPNLKLTVTVNEREIDTVAALTDVQHWTAHTTAQIKE